MLPVDDAVEQMVNKVKEVGRLGGLHGVPFSEVAARFGGKLTGERFKGYVNDVNQHGKVETVLKVWLGLIKSKKESLTKVLPSHKELSPSQGLPKVSPLSSKDLNERLEKLVLASGRLGLGLEQAVKSKSGPVTMDKLQGYIDSSDEKKRSGASQIMEMWTAALLKRKEEIKSQQGVTPKKTIPVLPSLASGASWVAFGIVEAGRNETLAAHNIARLKYGVPPLKYDPRLEPSALEWAAYLARDKKFEHCKAPTSPGFEGTLGENLAMSASMGSAWAPNHGVRVNGYVAEVKDYDLVNKKGKSTGGVIGHFTQVIWRTTKVVGCGYAVILTPDGWSRGIWVHRYHPPGNYGEDPWK